MKKQIIAIGGAALPLDAGHPTMLAYVLKQTKKKKPKVCFIGTAHGDAETIRLRYYAAASQLECQPTHLPLFARTPRDLKSFILEQDAIFVGGGNTRSMLAVWRDWGLDKILQTAWRQGIVLSGWSAGSICWFEQGITDSIAGPLTAMPCLGFLKGSNCPHYDSEPMRRPTFQKMVATGKVLPGLAADDGVGLHFIDQRLARVVSTTPNGKGWRVEVNDDGVHEQALSTQRLVT